MEPKKELLIIGIILVGAGVFAYLIASFYPKDFGCKATIALIEMNSTMTIKDFYEIHIGLVDDLIEDTNCFRPLYEFVGLRGTEIILLEARANCYMENNEKNRNRCIERGGIIDAH